MSINIDNSAIEKALHKREIQMELLINKFRMSILLFITIADFIVLFFIDKYLIVKVDKLGLYELVLTIIAIISVGGIQYFAKKKKYYYFLKYYTVTYDLLLTFTFGFVFMVVFDLPFPINSVSFALLLTIFFLFFNMLSILRIGKKIIIYSGILTLILNTSLLVLAKSPIMPIVYTSLFTIAFTIYNVWVSRFIVNFLIVNKKLNAANVKIEKANTDILLRNKEIEKQKNELEISHKKIIHSVNYAKRIQAAMLPASDLFTEHFEEHFIFYRPKDIVSGDFYWAKKVDDILYYAVADCTGHGVPGAFVSVLGISLLNEIVANNKDFSTAQILDELRDSIKTSLKQKDIKSNSKEGMDIALCAININTNEMQFAGAYNPLYVIRGGNLIELKADRQPIGVHRKEKDFTNNIINLQKGDIVYLFSDGYIDQFGGDLKEKFKTKRFKKLIIENSNMSLSEQYQSIEQTFDKWKAEVKQIDDVAILAVKIK